MDEWIYHGTVTCEKELGDKFNFKYDNYNQETSTFEGVVIGENDDGYIVDNLHDYCLDGNSNLGFDLYRKSKEITLPTFDIPRVKVNDIVLIITKDKETLGVVKEIKKHEQTVSKEIREEIMRDWDSDWGYHDVIDKYYTLLIDDNTRLSMINQSDIQIVYTSNSIEKKIEQYNMKINYLNKHLSSIKKFQ